MTKIAVKGPAAGLGSVTLEAPETDSELNLKLPSNSTQLIGNEGGDFSAMPSVNGALIIESGSNSDGEWVRWADGTQIVTRSWPRTVGTATAYGTGYRSSNASTWNFPLAFTSGSRPKPSLYYRRADSPSIFAAWHAPDGADAVTNLSMSWYDISFANASISAVIEISVTGRWK